MSDPGIISRERRDAVLSYQRQTQPGIDRLRQQRDEAVGWCSQLAAFLSQWRDCIAGVQMTGLDFERGSGLTGATAFLDRIEGEQK